MNRKLNQLLNSLRLLIQLWYKPVQVTQRVGS